MAGENVVGIDIVARLDSFRDELSKISDIGGAEAKALTAQLSKEIRGAEKAAKQATKASQDLAKTNKSLADATAAADKATRSAEDAFGKAGGSVAKLAGGLDLLVPGLGEVARGIADVADIGEVAAGGTEALGASLGATALTLGLLALAISPVIALWADYKQAEAEAMAAEERRQETLEGHVSLLGRVRDAQEAALVELGQLTDAERQEEQAARAWTAATEEQNNKLEDRSVALRVSLKEIDKHTARTQLAHLTEEEFQAVLDEAPKGLKARMDALKETTKAIADNEAAAQLGLDADIRRIRAHEANTEASRVETEAERQATEAKQRAAEAASRAAEATREQVEALRELNAQLHEQEAAGDAQRATYDAAIGKLDELAEADRQKMGTAEERLLAEHEAALQQLEDLRREAEVAAETATARENIEASALAARAAEDARYYGELDKLRQDDLAKEEKAAQEKAEALRDAAFSTAADIAGAVAAVSEAVGAMAEEGSERQKKLAVVAFKVGQGAAVASTVITTAEAAMKAYSAALTLGPPGLILAPIAAAATAAVGAAQVATILSQPAPKFHSGLAPDEIPATLTRGESVLSPRAASRMGGAEGVRRANRGEGLPAQQIVVVQQYQHRVFDAAVADNLKAPSSPLRQAVRAGRRVGHRTRS